MLRLMPILSVALALGAFAIPVQARDLACGRGEPDCRRFVAATAASRHLPPKGGQRHAVNAGRVSLELTDWELERERSCLAVAAYAEARDQGTAGMLAVMWVILNRVERGMHGAERPCEVVAQPAVIEAMTRPELRKQLRAIRRGAMPPLVAAR